MNTRKQLSADRYNQIIKDLRKLLASHPNSDAARELLEDISKFNKQCLLPKGDRYLGEIWSAIELGLDDNFENNS
jgi:hypothetical protein